MTTKILLSAIALLAVASYGVYNSKAALPPLNTVSYVDLDKYVGGWYEIATIPKIFEYGCTGTTATYTKMDGFIQVDNKCFFKSLSGEVHQSIGQAFVKDTTTNAKLGVRFSKWQPLGPYWIIELTSDYSLAMVGEPSRDYFWILSRTPQIDDNLYNQWLQVAKDKHQYDITRVVKTLQK